MTQQAKIVITAQDQATGVLNKIRGQLGGIGAAAKGMVALFAFNKVAQFFGQMVDIGSASSAKLKANIDGLKNTFTGYMATMADAVLGNDDLMEALKDLMSAIAPLVTSLLKALVPAMVSLVKVTLTVWDAVKPLVQGLLNILIPVFNRVITVAQILANSFLIVKNIISGNVDEVKRLRTENDKLSKSLITSPWSANIELTTGDKVAAQKKGAEVQKAMAAGARKESKKPQGFVFKDLLPKRSFGVSNTTTQQNVGPTPITASMVKIPEAAKEVQDKLSQQQQDFYDQQKALADEFLDDVGGIVSSRFTQVFSGDVLGGIKGFFSDSISFVSDGFKNFAMNWIKQSSIAFLKTFSFQAKIYAFYGKVMAGLAKLLGNPFTAGIAALGIAAGITALSRSLGGGGGGGGGFAGGGLALGGTQQQLAEAGNGRGNITVVFPEGPVDFSNPNTQRQYTKLFNEIVGNRGTNFAGA